MNAIISYMDYNVKILLKDKLPMIWSILLPSLFLFMNKTNVLYVKDLRFWWCYIIVSSYIYGVGIHALVLKESGCLKTIFSINKNSFYFFFGNLLTQIMYSFTCLFIFNLLAFMLFKFNILILLTYSLAMILMLIPIGFLGFSITLLKKIHVNSLSTFVNIVFMLLFYCLSANYSYNFLNPLYYLSNVIMIKKCLDIFVYVFSSIVFVIIGIYSIKRFSVIPTERR